MSANKIKTNTAETNDTKVMSQLRKGSLFHQAEIQVLIAIAEAHGFKVNFDDKSGEVTIERAELPKEATQSQPQSFAQMQRDASSSATQSGIDYVKLANALNEPVSKALKNAVESSPVHVQVAFDSSAHMENNKTVMTLARDEWVKWMESIGKETVSRLTSVNDSTAVTHPKGKAITFGEDTVYKVPENELDVAPGHRSGATEKRHTKHPRLRQLWSHVLSDIVTSWWKCFAYTIALCSLVLAAAAWYRQWQLEAVVKEYYIIKPVLKQDRKYAPLIHTMDSVILKDGIDEVCEKVYGERKK